MRIFFVCQEIPLSFSASVVETAAAYQENINLSRTPKNDSRISWHLFDRALVIAEIALATLIRAFRRLNFTHSSIRCYHLYFVWVLQLVIRWISEPHSDGVNRIRLSFEFTAFSSPSM
jgi:hypothetical protein